MIMLSGRGPDGRPIAVLGLSTENLRRLEGGEPILCDFTEMQPPARVVIVAGPTEQDILAAIGQHTAMVPAQRPSSEARGDDGA